MQPSIRHTMVLVLILAVAGALRINTFWLPHASINELHNTAMALKIDSFGLSGYNLRGINTDSFSLDGQTTIIELLIEQTDSEGSLLHTLTQSDLQKPDNSLYYQPPGLPYLLMLSQRLIGGGNGYFLASNTDGHQMVQQRPASIFQAQRYATIIPFIFSLLMIWLVYLLARKLFNTPTALIAAALMAINPVSMLAAQRIWSDEAGMGFILLSCLLLVPCLPAGKVGILSATQSTSPKQGAGAGRICSRPICGLLGFLSGVAAGIAYLFQPTAGIYLVVLLVSLAWNQRRSFQSLAGLRHIILNSLMWLFALGFLTTTAWWFYICFQTHGTPLYYPAFSDNISNEFYQLRVGRSHPLLFFTVGLVCLSPLFLAGLATAWRGVRHRLLTGRQWVFSLLCIWILSWFVMMSLVFSSQEHRHMLPAYPAMAMLAAWTINLLREWALPYTKNWKWLGINELLFVAFIIAARYTSITMAHIINSGAVL